MSCLNSSDASSYLGNHVIFNKFCLNDVCAWTLHGPSQQHGNLTTAPASRSAIAPQFWVTGFLKVVPTSK